ncbi:HIT-like domain-containing protein [Pilobolus umbonatus]|nr:HIT-like domain-containing protein [Pilobolus umbonatus]
MSCYRFGPHLLHESQVFYQSRLSLGVVNLKPIAPLLDVLILSKKQVPRLKDLQSEEVSDLMLSAQKVGSVLEKHYKGSSLTITIQDGPDAGQTVPHVHVHVIPRKKGDWANNDDIYEALDKSKGVDNEDRKPRTIEEMKTEADELRAYFT